MLPGHKTPTTSQPTNQPICTPPDYCRQLQLLDGSCQQQHVTFSLLRTDWPYLMNTAKGEKVNLILSQRSASQIAFFLLSFSYYFCCFFSFFLFCSYFPSFSTLFLLFTSSFRFSSSLWPGAVAESVEHWSRVWKIMGSNPGWVKPMTYKIDTCRFLARCSALLG